MYHNSLLNLFFLRPPPPPLHCSSLRLSTFPAPSPFGFSYSSLYIYIYMYVPHYSPSPIHFLFPLYVPIYLQSFPFICSIYHRCIYPYHALYMVYKFSINQPIYPSFPLPLPLLQPLLLSLSLSLALLPSPLARSLPILPPLSPLPFCLLALSLPVIPCLSLSLHIPHTIHTTV